MSVKIFAGVDEVGRGCLAGPVISCALILKENINKKILRDSKTISFKDRLKIADHIKKNSWYAFGSASAKEIDKLKSKRGWGPILVDRILESVKKISTKHQTIKSRSDDEPLPGERQH